MVDSDDEAIKLANDPEYGLSAAVYTENLATGLYVVGQIESGYAILSIFAWFVLMQSQGGPH